MKLFRLLIIFVELSIYFIMMIFFLKLRIRHYISSLFQSNQFIKNTVSEVTRAKLQDYLSFPQAEIQFKLPNSHEKCKIKVGSNPSNKFFLMFYFFQIFTSTEMSVSRLSFHSTSSKALCDYKMISTFINSIIFQKKYFNVFIHFSNRYFILFYYCIVQSVCLGVCQ